MTLLNKCTLALTLAIAVAAATAAQPTQSPRLCCQTVQGLSAEPIGFDPQGRAVFDIAIELACHGACPAGESLVVRIRDASIPPCPNPTAPEASWTYRGESSQPVTISFRLPVPLTYGGPLCIDALMTGPDRYAVILGPLMLPVNGSGLQPYGRVDTERNCVCLSCWTPSPVTVLPPIRLQIDRAPPGARVVFAVSPYRNVVTFSMGGRLLIGPAPIIPIGSDVVDGIGRATMEFTVPPEVWGARIPLYVQAACDSFDDGPEPWFFTNGLVLVRK